MGRPRAASASSTYNTSNKDFIAQDKKASEVWNNEYKVRKTQETEQNLIDNANAFPDLYLPGVSPDYNTLNFNKPTGNFNINYMFLGLAGFVLFLIFKRK